MFSTGFFTGSLKVFNEENGIQTPPRISIIHPNLRAKTNSLPVQKVSPFFGKITELKSNLTGKFGYFTVSGNSNLIFKAV